MKNLVNKKVELDLTEINGNTFALMGAFKQQARREGWTSEEIDLVISAAMQGDYNHLVVVLDLHCRCSEMNEGEMIEGDDDYEEHYQENY